MQYYCFRFLLSELSIDSLISLVFALELIIYSFSMWANATKMVAGILHTILFHRALGLVRMSIFWWDFPRIGKSFEKQNFLDEIW